MNIPRIIAAAVAFLIIAQVLHTISATLTMDYYTNPDYFAVWSKIMMPVEGAPPINFFIYSIVFGFITAIIYSFAYNLLKNSIPGAGIIKGLNYGLLLFFIAGIPSTLGMYLLINLPAGLLIYMTIIDSLLVSLIGGIVIAKILK